MRDTGERTATDPLAQAQPNGPAAAAERATADQRTADTLRDYMSSRERNRRYADYLLTIARKPWGVDEDDVRMAYSVLIDAAFANITDGIDGAEAGELQDLRSRLTDELGLTGHTFEHLTPAATAERIGDAGLIGAEVTLEPAVPLGNPGE